MFLTRRNMTFEFYYSHIKFYWHTAMPIINALSMAVLTL